MAQDTNNNNKNNTEEKKKKNLAHKEATRKRWRVKQDPNKAKHNGNLGC